MGLILPRWGLILPRIPPPTPVLYSAVTNPFRGYVTNKKHPKPHPKIPLFLAWFWKWVKWTTVWAKWTPSGQKCLKSGQNCSRSGQRKFIREYNLGSAAEGALLPASLSTNHFQWNVKWACSHAVWALVGLTSVWFPLQTPQASKQQPVTCSWPDEPGNYDPDSEAPTISKGRWAWPPECTICTPHWLSIWPPLLKLKSNSCYYSLLGQARVSTLIHSGIEKQIRESWGNRDKHNKYIYFFYFKIQM